MSDFSNFFNYLSNPYIPGIKHHVHELLKENYADHDRIVERVARTLATESDYVEFGKLISSLYISGFNAAVQQQKSQLEKLGYNVDLV